MNGAIVGTAGHIDHGKTSLVRALTGVNLDTSPEEQSRGITISLGFTSLELPQSTISIVDVPGHERLIRTMIAGAAGLDAVMLCVSAMDGVMPQTLEHLAILNLLGIKQGIIVLTMSDLVDEEMRELATDDIQSAVQNTFLENAPLVVTSAQTGLGLEELKAKLAAVKSIQRNSEGPFRMPVDRTFIQSGFGTVATGTTWSGQLEDGETVQLFPTEQSARVRGIQAHGEKASAQIAGRRTALNLAGIEPKEVPRGTWITTDSWPETSIFDVWVSVLSGSVLEHGQPIRFLHGTSERMGRIALFDDLVEGDGFAQIRLEAPVIVVPGDKFILRRTSPLETLGGGTVLDCWGSKLRKSNRTKKRQELVRLHAGDASVFLERAGEEGILHSDWRWRQATLPAATQFADQLFAPSVAARLQGFLLEALTQFHQENPLSLGAHRRELRRARLGHLPERIFDALLGTMQELGTIEMQGAYLRISGLAIELTEGQKALSENLAKTISEEGIRGIFAKVVHSKHPEPEALPLLRLLEADNRIVDIAGVGWVSTTSVEELRHKLVGWFNSSEELPPADFKALTELTRKHAIPWLEWLDKNRWTRRGASARLKGSQLGNRYV